MIKTPAFTLLYNNKSATADFAKDLIEAVFTDHLTGEADELDITLADPDRKWLGDWYPTKGRVCSLPLVMTMNHFLIVGLLPLMKLPSQTVQTPCKFVPCLRPSMTNYAPLNTKAMTIKP